MSRIAIMAAMPEELQALLDCMPDEHRVRHAGREFWLGHLVGQDVVVVLSRIGKVAAATTAALLVERFAAREIVLTGVAGGLAEGVAVGDVVVGRQFLQHDFDASPIFPRHEIPYYGRSTFDADDRVAGRLARAAHEVLQAAAEHLGAPAVQAYRLAGRRCHEGLIVSGDRFVSTTAESAALRAELPQALAVEMEGAAVAQVCHDLGVPFGVIRTISDRADDAAHVDFPAFLRYVASRFSAAVVSRYLSAV